MSKQTKKDSVNKDGTLYQLCVFDDRRGTEEGNEDDKVLVAWPSSKTSSTLASVVGLAQAMISFMSNFEPVSWAAARVVTISQDGICND